MTPAVIATQNLWRASALLARGLLIIDARRVPGCAIVKFTFADPAGIGSRDHRRVRRDAAMRRVIRARADIAHVVDVVRTRGHYTP
jgi:hypothetical protein